MYVYNGTASQFPNFLRGEEVPLNNSKRKNKKRKKG
jgi:hypothetical protein